MSGTSVDGLDVAVVRVHAEHRTGFASSPSAYAWQTKLEHTTTLAYPEALRRDLWQAMELSAVDLASAGQTLGHLVRRGRRCMAR